MDGRIDEEIGRALQRARERRALRSDEVATKLGEAIDVGILSLYERGALSIPMGHFCALARLYGAAPERLLADAVRASEGRPPVIIDLTKVEGLGGPEGRIVAGFVDEVRSLRGQHDDDRITIRSADVEVLATAAGKRSQEFLDLLQPVLAGHADE